MKDWIGFSAYTFKTNVGRNIRWVLKTDDVDSITKIYEKESSPIKFSDGPRRISGTQDWEARIDKSTDELYVEYNIDWVDKKKNKHIYDPKIAVKPGTFSFSALIIIVALIIFSIPTVMFFRRKLRNRNSKV